MGKANLAHPDSLILKLTGEVLALPRFLFQGLGSTVLPTTLRPPALNRVEGPYRSLLSRSIIHEVKTMNRKNLNHAGITGLFLLAFAPAAFAESGQFRAQPQVQQQQRQQIQNREHMPSDQGLQQREQIQNRNMTQEQERLHQQQMQERGQQRGMMQQGGQGMGPHGSGMGGGGGRHGR